MSPSPAPPPEPVSQTNAPAVAPPQPSIPVSPPSGQLSFTPDQIAFARKSVAALSQKGYLSFHFNPPLAAIVSIEPKIWTPMLHKEKAAFLEMLLAYLNDLNKSLALKDQVTIFALYNMTNRQKLAKAYLISLAPELPAGHIEITN